MRLKEVEKENVRLKRVVLNADKLLSLEFKIFNQLMPSLVRGSRLEGER